MGVVPFYNLTAGRHGMHRRHFCSFSNQRKVNTLVLVVGIAIVSRVVLFSNQRKVGKCCD